MAKRFTRRAAARPASSCISPIVAAIVAYQLQYDRGDSGVPVLTRPSRSSDLFTRMWPIDWPHYQETGAFAALMETIHIASLGTLLALVLALPVGMYSPRTISSGSHRSTCWRS